MWRNWNLNFVGGNANYLSAVENNLVVCQKVKQNYVGPEISLQSGDRKQGLEVGLEQGETASQGSCTRESWKRSRSGREWWMHNLSALHATELFASKRLIL